MPVFKEGDMLQAPGYIIVTTNSFLTSEKKLVMGAGVARDLKIKVPGIDLAFGKLIHTFCKHLGRYGLIFHNRYGAFQVRYRFNDKARADLIRFSAAALKGAAHPGGSPRKCLCVEEKGGLLWHIPLSYLKDLLLR